MNEPIPGASQVLVIDDDPDFQRLIEWKLGQHGLSVTCVSSASELRANLATIYPEAILLDWKLGDADGTELISLLKRECPQSPIIFSTAHGTPEVAATSIKLGAFDFLTKPIDDDHLLLTITRAREHGKLLGRLDAAEHHAYLSEFEGIVGRSPQMQTIFAAIGNVASTDVTVMISGESGTGKELVANAIHRLSDREIHPFVAINMASIPPNLAESYLFGHEKGSFTGAEHAREGAIGQAHQGTLFMDEITEMPMELQAKLLRFLQENTYRPVGATEEKKASARILCATNRNPMTAVQDGKLRQDLYYRLNVVPIVLPPLREREGDLVLLALRFVKNFSVELGKNFEGIEPNALEILEAYPWPGNVRELANLMQRIVVMNDGETVTPEMLPAEIFGASTEAATSATHEPVHTNGESSHIQASDTRLDAGEIEPLAEMERTAIERALKVCGGSAYEAARRLGISKATIYRKIRLYELNESND